MADDRKSDPPRPYQKSDFEALPGGQKRDVVDPEINASQRGRLSATIADAANAKTAPAPMEKQGSAMVEKDAPVFKPTPPAAIRNGPDSQVYAANLQAEARREAARQKLAEQLSPELEIRKSQKESVQLKEGNKDKGKDDHAR